jgi:hypothetical protein
MIVDKINQESPRRSSLADNFFCNYDSVFKNISGLEIFLFIFKIYFK